MRLLRKQSLSWYNVYEVRSRPFWNKVAVDATNTLFYWYQQKSTITTQKLSPKTNDGKGSVNVLAVTPTLELFASEYAKTHLEKKQSIIQAITEDSGMSICSMAISPEGRIKSVSEVFSPASH